MLGQAGCESAPDVELLLATLDSFLQSYFKVFSKVNTLNPFPVPMLLEPLFGRALLTPGNRHCRPRQPDSHESASKRRSTSVPLLKIDGDTRNCFHLIFTSILAFFIRAARASGRSARNAAIGAGLSGGVIQG